MKLVPAATLKKGSYVIINDAPCVVKDISISKTGKHGHAKARIEAIGILDNQKRIIVKPGNENIPVPNIEKKRGQVISVNIQDKKASVMDLESYETLEMEIDDDAKEDIGEGKQVEYWVVSNKKMIKRVIG